MPTNTQRRRAPDRRELISIQAAAKICSVTEKTIRRMIADSQLTGYRVRGDIRVDRNELEQHAIKVIDPKDFRP